MSLRTSLKDTFRHVGLRFSWIDLNKSKRKFAIVLISALAGASVLGAAAAREQSALETKTAASKNGLLNWLNPFGRSPSSGEDNLQLSKEYLYAESDLVAVEDAGATSAPPADLAIWRPSSGQWWAQGGEHSRQLTVQWGISSDVPAIGDYDGDGKTDFCVFRPSEGRWYLIKSSSGDTATSVITFGSRGDVAAQADYDGDGQTDIALWRPTTGVWYIKRSRDGGVMQVPLGSSGDVPNPKDFDGDGKADIAIWRSSNKTFYSVNSSDGILQLTNMGSSGSPVSGDYDGDGRDDFAVRSGASWKILKSSDSIMLTKSWQNDTQISVQNDYDGDGAVDIATWNPTDGRWYINQSSDSSTRIEQWGMQGDIPLPALYRR